MQQRRMEEELLFSIHSNSGREDSQFVREGWRRGLAGGQDHDDEDCDEEER